MNAITIGSKGLREVNRQLKENLNGEPVSVADVAEIHGICVGFKHGNIIIEGDAGDYLAALNAGATVRVTGNAGNYAADNMNDGLVVIKGNAGMGAGNYCYGGALVIHGDAGDFTATMNKGAVIIVGGNAGDEVATYMLKGDLVVVGDAGKNFANYLIRGNVYIGGGWETLGHNTRVDPLTDEDVAKLREYFAVYDIQANPADFKKIVAASPKPFYH